MRKTLHEYLVLADKEHTVVIKAATDVHTKAMLDNIRLALSKYDLRALEPTGRASLQERPKDFPHIFAAEVYTLEATLGILPNLSTLPDEIAIYTAIPATMLKVWEKGNEPKAAGKEDRDVTKTDPLMGTGVGDHPTDKAEPVDKLAGQPGIDALLAQLEREDREARARKEEALKKFVMSHLAIKEHMDVGLKKGFYICESKGGDVRVVDGPFDDAPAGLWVVSTSDSFNKIKSI